MNLVVSIMVSYETGKIKKKDVSCQYIRINETLYDQIFFQKILLNMTD